MGIKFKCPHGHKIHVKAFLAGKRALCPHCGEKVVVPLASTNDLAGAVAATAAAQQAGADPNDPYSAFTAEMAARPAVEQPAAGQPAAGQPAAGQPVVARGAPATLGAVSAPVVAVVPAGPAVRTAPASLAGPAGSYGAPVAAAPLPLRTVAARPSDPIAEAPLAVWYVRPPAGGQFGPAPGDMMRQWIAEGRVPADALVWREGWPEWNVASTVLPMLSSTAPVAAAHVVHPASVAVGASWSSPVASAGDRFAHPPTAFTAPTAAAWGPSATIVERTQSRPGAGAARPSRRSQTGALLFVGALAVLAVCLVGALIYVVSR